MSARHLFLLLVLVLVAVGCKKEETEPKIRLLSDTWLYYDITYQKLESKWSKRRRYNSYTDSLDVITFTATDRKGLLSLNFTEKPVTHKRYKIVYEPATADEVSINATGGAGGGHAGSQDDAGRFLYVSVTNGKLHFVVETVQLEVYTWVSNYDVECSVNLTE